MKKSVLLLLCVIGFQINTKLNAQTFYNINTIQKIEIQFSQSNWDYMMDTAKIGKDGYLVAQWVKVNGVQFDSAGVKYKGNSSYNAMNGKNPLHIELNYIKSQDYQGYKDIKLSNGFKDPSMVREALAYDIANKYMAAPMANYCQVYINGTYIGVYTNCEAVTKVFVNDRFYSKNNSFFFMDNFNCPLKYNGPDSASYTSYTIKSSTGWKNLINLCDTLNNKTSAIEKILDVDRTLWMMSFDNVLVNLDSYIGAPMHNYYAYQDNNSRFNPVIWDVNEAFGNFVNAGGGPALTLSGEQTMSPFIHLTDPNWPLIYKLLPDPMWKRMYAAHMRTIVNENFANGSYTTTAFSMQSVIDTAIQSDPNKFFTYAQFLSNVNNNVGTTAGLSVLMGPRVTYLNSVAELSAVPPTITSASAATTPSLSTPVTVTANVTNANSNGVYLGYRFALTQKFTRILMYDDGLHNDGVASDNIFGASFTMTASTAQYYVYAENNNAGMFEPQRAEHEFYTLRALQMAGVGQVYINEFLADNLNDAKDENLVNEDWIEFYNTTSIPLDLGGLFLSDDKLAPTKFAFPSNSVIQPNDYLIVWADEDVSTASYVHCNFKLATSGEQLILTNSTGAVLDSITFGPQITDKSLARCPDGTGSFTLAASTTFKATNCSVGVNELDKIASGLQVYPNPAMDYVIIKDGINKPQLLEMFNLIGETVYSGVLKGTAVINVKNFEAGIYIIRSGSSVKKIIINH